MSGSKRNGMLPFDVCKSIVFGHHLKINRFAHIARRLASTTKSATMSGSKRDGNLPPPVFRRSSRIQTLMNRTSPGPDHTADELAASLRRSASDPFQTAAAMLRFGSGDADMRTAQPGSGNLGEQGAISRGRVIPFRTLGRHVANGRVTRPTAIRRDPREEPEEEESRVSSPATASTVDIRRLPENTDGIRIPLSSLLGTTSTVFSIHGQPTAIRRTISRKEGRSTETRRTVSAGRLLKEAQSMANQAPPGCHASPKSDDLFEWAAVIEGPSDTVYDGGTFFCDLIMPRDYPFRPPKVVFRTRIYHCNINAQGEVCVDVLGEKWNSTMTVCTVLQSLLSLMYHCNPDDALVTPIAQQFKEDRELFDKTARIWTTRYAN